MFDRRAEHAKTSEHTETEPTRTRRAQVGQYEAGSRTGSAPVVDHAWNSPADPPPWTDDEIFNLTRRLAEDPSTRAADEAVDIEAIRTEFASIATRLGIGDSNSTATLTHRARLVAHHQALMFEAITSVVDEYEREIADPNVDSFRGASAELSAALVRHRRSTTTLRGVQWAPNPRSGFDRSRCGMADPEPRPRGG
jgi:hypothetical protein